MYLIDATLCYLDAELIDVSEIRRLAHALVELGVESLLVTPKIAECLNGFEKRCRILMPYTARGGAAKLKNLFDADASFDTVADESCFCGLSYAEWQKQKQEKECGDIKIISSDADTFFTDYPAVFQEYTRSYKEEICLDSHESGIFAGALAYEWMVAGGKNVLSAFLGLGGYAPTEELLATMYVHGWLPKTVDMRLVQSIARQIESETRVPILPHKAVLGEHIFFVESGMHVNGIQKHTSCFEPFSPDKVGSQRKVLIGTHTSPTTLAQILERCGILATETERAELMRQMRSFARNGKRNPEESDIVDLYLKIRGERTG